MTAKCNSGKVNPDNTSSTPPTSTPHCIGPCTRRPGPVRELGRRPLEQQPLVEELSVGFRDERPAEEGLLDVGFSVAELGVGGQTGWDVGVGIWHGGRGETARLHVNATEGIEGGVITVEILECLEVETAEFGFYM